MQKTEQSKLDWEKFRELEEIRHKGFFLPAYELFGYEVVEDIFDDVKTNDYDVIVKDRAGKLYKVDEKARQRDYDDLLVEVMQCLRAGRIGWLYKPIDMIFYASWTEPEGAPSSAYLVDLSRLKEFVIENYEELPEFFSTKGYGLTLNKRTSWKVLEDLKIAEKVV